MGFTLNGNTGMIVIALLAVVDIVCMTAIVVAGGTVPGVMSDALIALVAAAGGGGVIHRLQYQDKRDLQNTVSDAVEKVAAKDGPAT